MTSISASGVYQCLAEVKIVNRKGLHARASMAFVKCVEEFDAEVTVMKDGLSVNGTSIMSLLMLAAGPGCEIELRARGAQAQAAIVSLAALVAAGFDEN